MAESGTGVALLHHANKSTSEPYGHPMHEFPPTLLLFEENNHICYFCDGEALRIPYLQYIHQL